MASFHSKQSSIGNGTSASDLTTSYKFQPSKLYRAFLDDPTLSDVTIRLSNRSVYAHRIVLCRGSEYFASMFIGRFQESASSEIELQEDDPHAMLALLRFLYDLPYDAEANSKWITSLHPHAQVYEVADKYQIEPLKEAIAENMQKIITDKRYTHKMGFLRHCETFKRSEDFYSTLQIILEVTTTSDTLARKVLVDFIIQNVDFFRKQEQLLALFKEHPDLAVEIISHKDLETEAEGFWMCFSDDCDTNVPSCSACRVCFEPYYLRRYRYDDQWECQACKFFGHPTCVECKAKISWVPDPASDSNADESGDERENAMDC